MNEYGYIGECSVRRGIDIELIAGRTRDPIFDEQIADRPVRKILVAEPSHDKASARAGQRVYGVRPRADASATASGNGYAPPIRVASADVRVCTATLKATP